MAAGIRLPGVPSTSALVFLLFLSFVLAGPIAFLPRSHPCAGVFSRSAYQPLPRGTCHPLVLVPPVAAPTFLHVVTPSSRCGPGGYPLPVPVPLVSLVCSCSVPQFHVTAVLAFVLSSSSSPLLPFCRMAYVCFPITCFIFSAPASISVFQGVTTELSLP